MKKWFWLVTLLLSVSLVATFGYIFKDPPLQSNGFSTYTIPNDDLKLSIEVKNHGIEKVKVKEVLINGGQNPDRTAVGVGNRLVLGDIENSSDFSLHSPDDLSILPSKEVTGSRLFLHYGIVIWDEEPVQSVEIVYTYLGIPYSLTIETGE